ncbi:uncharacterized protein BP5553_02475 [Venustampulla echinocandica]|uniref:Uncharacterized protein n=1 Tax=Venustampulla echinocandica TaxID=2656787 RepID=A0A370U3Z4_9HELO|nr:uncharacterized protein BP5553_02475 [Venustampulla echinocandica]RDL42496.1 hypothetical protein BP5553_02475 [Venustampulla echinocandica]
MSSDADSPPETPLKNPTSTENTMSRTPLRDDVDDGTSEHQLTPRQNAAPGDGWASEKPSQAGNEVQIPPTPRIPKSGQESPTSQDGDDTNTDDEGRGPGDAYNEDLDAPLPQFDWDGVRNQYTKAVKEVISEEEELLEQFTKYTQLFVSWAESAAERDNTKASKRLKTCERHVKLQEQSLEEKKKHYASVVDAFQKALDLLRR